MHEDEIDLRELLRQFWRARWWVGAGAVVPAVVVALVSAFVLPPSYEARAVLMVTSPQVQTVDPGNPAVRVGGDLNVVAVLKPEMSAEAFAAFARAPAVTSEVARRTGVAADWLERRIQAATVRGTNLVELKARAFDRKTASSIVAAWAEVLVERSREAFASQAEEVWRFAERLRSAQAALERADVEWKDFVSRSRIGEYQARLAKLTEQLATYEVRANDLDVALVRARAEFQRLQEEVRRQPNKLVMERTLSSDPFLLQVVTEASGANAAKVARLTLRVEEQNPVFNAVSQSYVSASAAVAALRAEKARVEYQLRAVRDEIAKVRARLAEEQLEETRLRRRVDTARRVYEALLQRREEARIAASSRLGTVEVVAPAATREKPVSPRPGLNAAVAGTLGFLVAVFGVLVRDAWASAPQPASSAVTLVPERR